jgi:hypothetical protein
MEIFQSGQVDFGAADAFSYLPVNIIACGEQNGINDGYKQQPIYIL